jgi:hypothetical protein
VAVLRELADLAARELVIEQVSAQCARIMQKIYKTGQPLVERDRWTMFLDVTKIMKD